MGSTAQALKVGMIPTRQSGTSPDLGKMFSSTIWAAIFGHKIGPSTQSWLEYHARSGSERTGTKGKRLKGYTAACEAN